MVGQVGVVGPLAPNPVELVPKNAPEAAQILVHNMVANPAQGLPSWNDRVTNSLAPYTVVGQDGAGGLHAPNPVELVPKNVFEDALMLDQNMVVDFAQAKHVTKGIVTRNGALLTVAGQVGVAGLHAPIHVEKVLENAPEAVQILAHNMVAILAQGPPSWYDHAISSPVPWMEDGQAGVYGQTAATPVMLENRGDHERARHRPLYMEENPVQEQGMSSGCATRIHAQSTEGGPAGLCRCHAV